MKKISFCTLGCKVNQYETEAMTSLFKNRGYEIASFNDVCDIYIINTCTVTGEGERKSRQMIRRAHNLNPQAVILVTGCYSQVSPEKVKALEGVSIVMGTSERTRVVEIVEEYINQNKTPSVEDIMKKRNYEEMNISSYEDKTRAFVKIEDGCTEFCTYCIIPYARGPVRSRNPESITKEVTELAKNGYREIVLTGIHIGSYGKDLKDKTLLDAIKAVNEVPDIKRIRLGSVEPRVLTEEFIEEISKMPKVCDHFHISLQSGCNRTLKAMNRKYTAEEYKEAVCNLRKKYKNPAITTDIIAGFPGETEEDFNESYEFMKEISFSEAHIFPYSARKGTKAADFPGQLEKKVKNERAKKMIELSKKLHNEYLSAFIGETKEVLFERKTKDGFLEGHLSNYICVRVKSNEDLAHKFALVKIDSVKDGIAYGILS
ncbi:MAG: tRNA (N(6)-L-threonylcarbamoyladenosine(37)-C(2))-methylthiotransferase MtaB [Clostridia bacterium]|nr:tRNA (N(6)-L-threonylcarbamoyladenosine(37)-C(2))-methylthiotransferase MtaB [Clostridia bacterium]